MIGQYWDSSCTGTMVNLVEGPCTLIITGGGNLRNLGKNLNSNEQICYVELTYNKSSWA